MQLDYHYQLLYEDSSCTNIIQKSNSFTELNEKMNRLFLEWLKENKNNASSIYQNECCVCVEIGSVKFRWYIAVFNNGKEEVLTRDFLNKILISEGWDLNY